MGLTAHQSRTRRFVGGLSLGYLNQFVVMLAGLWVTPFLLRRLGSHEYGLWLMAAQVLTYLALLDFGIITLLPRGIAYITGRLSGDARTAELSRLLGETAKLLGIQMPIVFAIGLALWFSIPQSWDALRRPFGLFLIAFMVLFPSRIFLAALQGVQDLAFAGKALVGSSLILPVVSAVLVYEGMGLYALPISWTLSQAALAGICFVRVRTRFPGMLPTNLPPIAWDRARGHLHQGMWITISQIAQVLLNGTDLFIIARLLGPAAVVPYAFTGKLIAVLSNQPNAVMQAAGPALSEMKTSESPHRQLQACNALSQATLLFSGAIACVVLVVNRAFVDWWVGPNRFAGSGITILLLAAMMLRHWNNPLVYAIFCFGGERRLALTTLLDGAVTVCGTVLMLQLVGIQAAPLASIAGVLIISLPANLWALARHSGMTAPAVLAPLGPWFWRFSILAACLGAVALVWTPAGPVSILATAAAVSALYAAVMFSTALSGPLGVYLKPRVLILKGELLGKFILGRANA